MRALILVAAPLLAGLAFVACSSSSDPEPPGTTFTTDTGTPATETATPDTNVDDTGSSTEASADSGTETAIDSGAPDTAGCVTEAGCFNCKATTNEQFLNHCTGSSCSPFDNSTRIPASTWDGGKLPAVP